MTVRVELDTCYSSGHKHKGATDRLWQDQYGRNKWSCHNIQGTQTRETQNSEMLYHFLMNSVTMEFTTKLVLYHEDYMINGAPIGACLFKKVIQLMYMDTMATASHIRKTLMDINAFETTYFPA